MSIKVRPAQGAGAYISGVDLNCPDKSELDTIRQALGEHGVVFFRDQSITPEKHILLAEQFGTININRFFTPVAEYPQIAQVLKEPDQKKNIGEKWHTDHSYDQEPALGSILVARELPDTGGDTLFASMFNAYEAMSQPLKTRIDKLAAVHSSRHVFGKKAFSQNDRQELQTRLHNAGNATQDALHPIVIKHPISGKRAVYVNPEFTVRINELPEKQSDALLEEVYAHCGNEEFIHRFSWEPGSVAFWDNRATWHRALNDYVGQRRYMHRITIAGEALHS